MKTSCDKCGSSDANHVYEDGHTHCFSCNTTTFPNNKTESKPVMTYEPTTYTGTNIRELAQLNSYALTSRGISKEVVEFFGVKMGFDSNRKPASHYYPYTIDGQTVAYKERILPKDFRVHGQFKNIELFGQSLFSGGRTLVIVEGEIDTLIRGASIQGIQRARSTQLSAWHLLAILLLSSAIVIGSTALMM